MRLAWLGLAWLSLASTGFVGLDWIGLNFLYWIDYLGGIGFLDRSGFFWLGMNFFWIRLDFIFWMGLVWI